MDELKSADGLISCAFCRGPATIRGHSESFYGACSSNKCGATTMTAKTVAEAQAIWNTRAAAPVADHDRALVECIRSIAKSNGWGIGEHGSMVRDIDLIAVPWTKEAAPWASLKHEICEALGYRELSRDTERPHGRRTALLVEQNATHEQELHNNGEFIGPPNPKGQWIPKAIDLSFVDPREGKPEQPAAGVTDAARDVLAERKRQIDAEGWTPAHDDEHNDGSMADAAACYALTAPVLQKRYWIDGDSMSGGETVPSHWPRSWRHEWWKPKGRRRDLVRAGALILAEIERLDRAALGAGVGVTASQPPRWDWDKLKAKMETCSVGGMMPDGETNTVVVPWSTIQAVLTHALRVGALVTGDGRPLLNPPH